MPSITTALTENTEKKNCVIHVQFKMFPYFPI